MLHSRAERRVVLRRVASRVERCCILLCRQVTSESVNDVCLEQKGVCVIAFLKPQTPGGTPSSADMGVLLGLKNKFEANIDRGN